MGFSNIISGKYDLAGSEFKIWPSNYDLEEDNLEKKLKIWRGAGESNF